MVQMSFLTTSCSFFGFVFVFDFFKHFNVANTSSTAVEIHANRSYSSHFRKIIFWTSWDTLEWATVTIFSRSEWFTVEGNNMNWCLIQMEFKTPYWFDDLNDHLVVGRQTYCDPCDRHWAYQCCLLIRYLCALWLVAAIRMCLVADYRWDQLMPSTASYRWCPMWTIDVYLVAL